VGGHRRQGCRALPRFGVLPRGSAQREYPKARLGFPPRPRERWGGRDARGAGLASVIAASPRPRLAAPTETNSAFPRTARVDKAHDARDAFSPTPWSRTRGD
jgi:hypothetical protein